MLRTYWMRVKLAFTLLDPFMTMEQAPEPVQSPDQLAKR